MENPDEDVFLRCSYTDYKAILYSIELYEKELYRRSKKSKHPENYKPKYQIPKIERIILEQSDGSDDEPTQNEEE